MWTEIMAIMTTITVSVALFYIQRLPRSTTHWQLETILAVFWVTLGNLRTKSEQSGSPDRTRTQLPLTALLAEDQSRMERCRLELCYCDETLAKGSLQGLWYKCTQICRVALISFKVTARRIEIESISHKICFLTLLSPMLIIIYTD